MSILERLRPTPPTADEIVARHLRRLRGDLEPDPGYRRRLRGHLLNLYVADRERLAVTSPSRLRRVGRAALIASFALGVSVTGAMAASRDALPGDLLYPLKRQIEELRQAIAPAHLQDDLAVAELAERIDELARLTAAGDDPHASGLIGVIGADYASLSAAGAAAGPPLDMLASLVADLPASVRASVESAIHKASHRQPPAVAGDDEPADEPGEQASAPASDPGEAPGNGHANGNRNNGGTNNGGTNDDNGNGNAGGTNNGGTNNGGTKNGGTHDGNGNGNAGGNGNNGKGKVPEPTHDAP